MGPPRVKYLLDSVIFIDHFNGIAPASAFLSEHGAASAMSVITRVEVLCGFDEAAVPRARALLDRFPVLPITADVADLAAALRRHARLKLPDALQAAVAIDHGLTLVTRDTRDFVSTDELPVLVPYKVG